MSFADKLYYDKGPVVHLFSATEPETGRPVFAYVITDKERMDMLEKHRREAAEAEAVRFADYGRIIHSGYGEPTQDDEAIAEKNIELLVEQIASERGE